MELSWIIFIAIVVALYAPTFRGLYRRWKRARDAKRAPSTLLGVVYPKDTKDKKDK